MRFRMKQRLIALGGTYAIETEQAQPIFLVDGAASRLRGRLSFTDMAGQELAYLRARYVPIRGRYHIYRGGQIAASVARAESALHGGRYSVQRPDEEQWITEGAVLNYEYTLRTGNVVAAHVSRRWFPQPDSYGVEIPADQEAILLLIATAVIDLLAHTQP